MIKTEKGVKKVNKLYSVTARIESLNFRQATVQTKASPEYLHLHADNFHQRIFYLFVTYNGMYCYSIYLDEQRTIFVFDVTNKDKTFDENCL